MKDVSVDLQDAVVRHLKGYAPLAAVIGDRVFDHVKANAPTPYVSLGPDQVVSDDAECITGFEISLQIDVWSTKLGFGEAKKIAGLVREALDGDDLKLSDNALLSIEHRQTRNLRDPDGVTSHAAMEFTALVERP